MADQISDRLVALMDEKKVTVKMASEAADVSTSTIQSWRSGTLPTNFKAVQRLAEALGVSFSFLLTGTDDTKPDGPPTLAEIIETKETLFEGLLEVKINRIIPRRKT